ncbi:hypothetical protein IMZ31_19050 (plasmid) [Pontibacillus sp. ALD_SL1]|uniref:hypothetical protein n=1 Tax=Pontibacillus sp. ALD_SL1 TaxID=2777185 RepID=UPI001A970A92|nr:hypothetical protein [Pontibacillus sp. ALD_SL1]QST02648.1 hypothetical protein IMZ31_19050 [Pontibacillus sp. ALD_SL1]
MDHPIEKLFDYEMRKTFIQVCCNNEGRYLVVVSESASALYTKGYEKEEALRVIDLEDYTPEDDAFVSELLPHVEYYGGGYLRRGEEKEVAMDIVVSESYAGKVTGSSVPLTKKALSEEALISRLGEKGHLLEKETLEVLSFMRKEKLVDIFPEAEESLILAGTCVYEDDAGTRIIVVDGSYSCCEVLGEATKETVHDYLGRLRSDSTHWDMFDDPSAWDEADIF